MLIRETPNHDKPGQNKGNRGMFNKGRHGQLHAQEAVHPQPSKVQMPRLGRLGLEPESASETPAQYGMGPALSDT